VLAAMQAVRSQGAARVFARASDAPPMPAAPVLDRIRKRGVVRVGFFDDTLPYAFFNAKGDLVGFDIEMAHQLASDLGVGLELVPTSRTIFEESLSADACDLVMSGTVMTAPRAMHVLFSTIYLDETLAFFVPDHMRASFSDWNQVRAMPHLRLGVPHAPYYLNKIHTELPNAEIVPIDSFNDVFGHHDQAIDAFVTTAERGSAYTLLHPEYSVAVPKPRPLRVPLAYVIAGRDEAFARVVNSWVELKQKDGTIDDLFAHWILGRDASPPHRRWSVLDDVLHWPK
jgi:ABC-type amino acid transport substrate-binding protein